MRCCRVTPDQPRVLHRILIVSDDVSRDGNDPYMKAEIIGPTGTF